MSEVKILLEITRPEWAAFNWIEVTGPGDRQRKFIRGFERLPHEAAQAVEDFDAWLDAARSIFHVP